MMDVLQALRGDQWLANHPDAPAELRARDQAAHARRVLRRTPTTGRRWSTRRRASRARAGRWQAPRAGPLPHERRRSRRSLAPPSAVARACARLWDSDVAWSFRHSPVAMRRSAIVLGICVARGAVRAVGRAAQSVRPAHAEPARRAAAAGVGGGRQAGVSCSAPTTRAATCCRRSCSARASRCWSASPRSRSRWCSASALGLLAGYVGGKIDAFIMRVADVQLSFPAILIALLIDGVARVALPRDAHDAGRARGADPRDRRCRTGCSTRAPCAARRWSRRTRNTCRRRASSA